MDPLRLPPGIASEAIAICARIRDNGGRAYLVGGCIRDMFMHVIPKDLDMEVFDIAPEALRDLFPSNLFPTGKSFGVYKYSNLPIDIGIPRQESAVGFGHRDFEIFSDPNLSLPLAASRRDFTINAIYWDPLENCIEDPFGGMVDMREKVLRHVSPKFIEDQLRVLRGMQFVARFDLHAAEQTINLCRQLTLKNLSAERIYAEFCKLLLYGHSIGKGIQFLHQTKCISFFPELAALGPCRQDPIRHPEGCVLRHVACALDAYATLRPELEWDALVTGFGVLCHDFGKPACTRWNRAGRLSAKGHARAGLVPTDKFLTRMRAPKQLIKEVLPLVEFHMLPRQFSRPEGATQRALNWLAYNVQRIDRLLVVARCDNMGRPPRTPNLTGENTLENLAFEANLLKSPPIPLIRGRDLQINFGMDPSPKMGPLLKRLFEAQLDGKFYDLTTGVAHAKKILKKIGGQNFRKFRRCRKRLP
ncbi:MAG: polynucleotide adenylyltransferase [Puniceicoccales bacterium]|jgi:tRNA nucleotidyltransferase (CCA-adding enzyme)|nr:polynucleotide adenylyltransferase [Puniceicoccales bacterium]